MLFQYSFTRRSKTNLISVVVFTNRQTSIYTHTLRRQRLLDYNTHIKKEKGVKSSTLSQHESDCLSVVNKLKRGAIKCVYRDEEAGCSEAKKYYLVKIPKDELTLCRTVITKMKQWSWETTGKICAAHILFKRFRYQV